MKTSKPAKPKKIKPPPPADLSEKLERYLLAIREGNRHGEASLIADVSWTQVINECARNREYNQAYKDAVEFRDVVWKHKRYEDAHHRATVGVPRSVTCGKGICGTDYVPSDKLMEVLLKRDHPEWFENKTKGELNAAPALVELLMQLEGKASKE